MQYLKFGWSYSNQTWTVSSWKGCSHFTGIPCPWGGMGSKCRTWRFMPYHFDFVAAGGIRVSQTHVLLYIKIKRKSLLGTGSSNYTSFHNIMTLLFLSREHQWCRKVSDRRIWLTKFHSDWQKFNISTAYFIVRTDKIFKISPNDWHVQKDFNISGTRPNFMLISC